MGVSCFFLEKDGPFLFFDLAPFKQLACFSSRRFAWKDCKTHPWLEGKCQDQNSSLSFIKLGKTIKSTIRYHIVSKMTTVTIYFWEFTCLKTENIQRLIETPFCWSSNGRFWKE